MKNLFLVTILFVFSQAYSQGFTGFTFKNIEEGDSYLPVYPKGGKQNFDSVGDFKKLLIDDIEILNPVDTEEKALIYELHNKAFQHFKEIINLQDDINDYYLAGRKDKIPNDSVAIVKVKQIELLKNSFKNDVEEINRKLYNYTSSEKKDELAQYSSGNGFLFPNRYVAKGFHKMLYSEGNNNISFIKNTGFSIGDQSGSIYSELLSGNLGAFRVSLGSMIAASNQQDEELKKEEEAYQRLINYGGNTVLTFDYPLFYWKGRSYKSNFLGRFIVKGAADFPAFGTTTDKWAGNGMAGLNLYYDLSLDENNLRFFFDFNGNIVFGTDSFRNNLGVENNNFAFGQLVVGLVVLENIKLSFNLATISSEKVLEGRNVTAGGQILNNQK